MYNPMMYGLGSYSFFPGMILFGAVMMFFILIFGVALYIYYGFAFSTIAKKLKYKQDWLAWIPIANLFLLPILAKKQWQWGFLLFVPIANIVFAIIWLWAIYERRKYPGWLSLIPIAMIIPMIGWLAGIAQLIVIGFVAWKDQR